MYCPNCGSANDEGAAVCANCGQQLAPTAAPAPPAPPAPPIAPAQPAPPVAPSAPAPPAGYAAPPAPPAPPAGYQPQPGYAQPQPTYAAAPAPAGPPVKSHLVMAILATFFCCLPFGVVGIVFASQVNSKLAAGDYLGAQKASKSAAMWSWIAIALGLVGGILYAAVVALGVVAEAGGF